jgi:hypothetical protein
MHRNYDDIIEYEFKEVQVPEEDDKDLVSNSGDSQKELL